MTGTATRTDVNVAFYGDGTTHWRVEPALEGHDFILICDRTQLVALPLVKEEAESTAGITVETRIPHAVEVLASDADGFTLGDSMVALRQFISLRRHSEGIDLTEILARLGYEEGGHSA